MTPIAYPIPLRADLGGLSLQVLDLVPNTALRSTLDPEGQTFYVGAGVDQPGPTRTARGLYVGGSRTTSPLPAIVGFDYNGDAAVDAYGPSDVSYGLTAYLLDRATADPAGKMRLLTSVEATQAAQAILLSASKRQPLRRANIESILATAAGVAVELVAASAASASFGQVEDVVRLLAGETYGLPAGVPLVDGASKRLTPAQRQAIADALPGVIAPMVSGRFLQPPEGGFHQVRSLMVTEALLASNAEGHLSQLKPGTQFVAKNPRFAYAAGSVLPYLPRAVLLDGTPVPESGYTDGALVVYTADGVPLL